MSEGVPFQRRIRSFVKREGRMTLAQQHAIKALLPIYGILWGSDKPLDFKKIFNRDVPVTLEIGFGMGASLLQMAIAQPEEEFIGIEVHRPGVGTLLQAVDAAQISNIRIFNHDAVEVLQQMIADESLSRVLIFFPDPWPKKRHHKRRLIQTEFIELLCQKLKPAGRLHLATDWEDYAWQMLRVLTQQPHLVNLAPNGKFINNDNLRPETKFEQRGKRLGHGVWDLMFSKANAIKM